MNTLKIKRNIMDHLGCGLSVESLCKECKITYDELCALAAEHIELMYELKRWYKRCDFVVKKPIISQILDEEERAAEAGMRKAVELALSGKPAVALSFEDKPLEIKEKPVKRSKKVI